MTTDKDEEWANEAQRGRGVIENNYPFSEPEKSRLQSRPKVAMYSTYPDVLCPACYLLIPMIIPDAGSHSES